jgi:hypothetical protein
MRVWSRDRFDAAGKITLEMAASALRRDASQEMKERMCSEIKDDRQAVRLKMREQVHELLRMGAEITKMSYACPSTHGSRACTSPKTMRESFINDGSPHNIKCLHWIFDQLPFGTHRDVLSQRRSHMDLAVDKVKREMNITWESTKDGGDGKRNCLENCYAKMLNDKKQTIIKEEGTTHRRKPVVRRPKTAAEAGYAKHYKKGKTMYSWSSNVEGNHSVSQEREEVKGRPKLLTTVCDLLLDGKVNYDDDDDWMQWNTAAKLRILTRPSTAPPMDPYFVVKHRVRESVATPISSLAISSGEAMAARPVSASSEVVDETPESNYDSDVTLQMGTKEQLEKWKRAQGIDLGTSAAEEGDSSGIPGTLEDSSDGRMKVMQR